MGSDSLGNDSSDDYSGDDDSRVMMVVRVMVMARAMVIVKME